MADFDRFGNLVDENGHDILEDATDEELGFDDEDDDYDDDEPWDWEEDFDAEDDTFFATDVDPYDTDLGDEY